MDDADHQQSIKGARIGVSTQHSRVSQDDIDVDSSEARGSLGLRTHDLEVLLRLSGQEATIKQNHFLHWNAAAIWSPESRYRAIGSVTPGDAAAMIRAADALLKVL